MSDDGAGVGCRLGGSASLKWILSIAKSQVMPTPTVPSGLRPPDRAPATPPAPSSILGARAGDAPVTPFVCPVVAAIVTTVPLAANPIVFAPLDVFGLIVKLALCPALSA